MKIWPAPNIGYSERALVPGRRAGRLSIVAHLLLHAASEFMEDNIMNVAAAATFYILLGFFPAIAAFVSLYGLFAKIETVRAHLSYLAGFLPENVLSFVGNEMVRITATHPSRLS